MAMVRRQSRAARADLVSPASDNIAKTGGEVVVGELIDQEFRI